MLWHVFIVHFLFFQLWSDILLHGYPKTDYVISKEWLFFLNFESYSIECFKLVETADRILEVTFEFES